MIRKMNWKDIVMIWEINCKLNIMDMLNNKLLKAFWINYKLLKPGYIKKELNQQKAVIKPKLMN